MCRKFTKAEFMEKLLEKNEYVRNGDIEIIGEYNGLEERMEYLCHKCNTVQNPVAASLFAGCGCKVCGKVRQGKTQSKSNQKFQSELEQIRQNGRDIYTNDEYINRQTKMLFHCAKGHEWIAMPSEILKGNGCPYCSNKRVLVGYNDIATTSPEIFEFLADKNDGYKYTRGSNKRVDFKCPLCGNIQNRKISTIAHRGFKCEHCGDSISYPNKFGRALFDQLLPGKYKTEYSSKWCKPYVYDFYFQLNNEEYVVELDGRQHSEDRDSFYRTLAEHQAIDEIKNKIAEQNGIHLIRIDCAKSEPDYIRYNIEKSELNFLFDLSNVNWVLCDEHAQKNLVKIICDAWASGIQSFDELSDKFHLGNSTVRDYINRGTRLGWCNYDPKWWIADRYHPVRVIDISNNQEYLFRSLGECADASVNFSDHRIAEETIRKYSQKGVPYNGLLFEITNSTIQN